MRSLALLGLIALSTLPLAARDRGYWRGRGPRRGVVMESHAYRADDRCDGDRYDRDRYDRDRYDRDRYDDDRWDRRSAYWRRRTDCDDEGVVVVRPRLLAAPWQARVVLRFGR